MGDRVYTEGFPELWSMVHRDDCTLLVRSGDGGHLVVPGRAVCMAPKLMQGEDWLETAKEIAHALAGSHRRELDRIFAEFCDSCGIGPPYDEGEQPRANVRALRTWTCDRCDHVNVRPKADTPSPRSNLRLLREADNRLERDSVHDISGVIGDFEHLTVDRDAFEHLLAHHFPGRLDGLFVGEVVAGHLRSFRILLENAVFADVEEVSGHACTSGLSARTSSIQEGSRHALPPAAKSSWERS